MKGISVPNNSSVNLNEGSDLSLSSTTHSTPISDSKVKRKSRVSETDFSIIEKSMSIEKRKTLLCAEQNSFHILHKMKSSKFPGKKFNSMVPSEYEKFKMKILNIKINPSENLKYDYPPDMAKNGEINLVSGKEKRVKTVTCTVF